MIKTSMFNFQKYIKNGRVTQEDPLKSITACFYIIMAILSLKKFRNINLRFLLLKYLSNLFYPVEIIAKAISFGKMNFCMKENPLSRQGEDLVTKDINTVNIR